jgi:hypothetical protein
MASAELLGEGEIRHCWFCDGAITLPQDTHVVWSGDPEEPWHTECADSVGIIVEFDEDEHDPDFDHDPDYDGAKEDDE